MTLSFIRTTAFIPAAKSRNKQLLRNGDFVNVSRRSTRFQQSVGVGFVRFSVPYLLPARETWRVTGFPVCRKVSGVLRPGTYKEEGKPDG
ncbi:MULTISPECIES: hypothetical protein [Tatumella]|uniref:Uncharacterized protein n=2 Tax=Tatumella ptyseos TaxID=82987 RepID=A0A085JMB9_9GAMM|nr:MULTISPECIES: hypothetical protein [Tatumella]KFD21615.1 hypothetical protein GTPT_0714 [Tatumella ptyseos ATCC 33301]SQK77247.1 Uncharacterised protein [Tatumella ptyseos]